MAQQLLEGQVEDERDHRIADLELANRQLRSDLAIAHAEVSRLTNETGRALGSLRRQLQPLYRALQSVFSELDAAGVDYESASAAASGAPRTDHRTMAVWESWKSKLPAGCGKVIDALLLHGDMNTQQLAIAVQMHRTSIPKLIHTLNKAGLINKNGGRFSLKPLP